MIEHEYGDDLENVTLMILLWSGPHIIVWVKLLWTRTLSPNVKPGQGYGVTCLLYIDQLLRPLVLSYFVRYPNYIFQHDNARGSRIMRDFRHRNYMYWPVLSPNMNTIVHLWDKILRCLSQTRPINAAVLTITFQGEWKQIPVAFINWLIHSIYRIYWLIVTYGTFSAVQKTDTWPHKPCEIC